MRGDSSRCLSALSESYPDIELLPTREVRGYIDDNHSLFNLLHQKMYAYYRKVLVSSSRPLSPTRRQYPGAPLRPTLRASFSSPVIPGDYSSSPEDPLP